MKRKRGKVSYQLSHNEFKEKQIKHNNNIVFVLENFEHIENIGSAFRLADAFNIKKIYIVSNKEININKIKKTSRNTEKYVPYEIVSTIEIALEKIKDMNYTPFCVEICSDSEPLRNVDFSKYFGVALILGNENFGVSERALKLIDNKIHIDMYGNNSSMNVSTALAITVYKVSEDRFKKI